MSNPEKPETMDACVDAVLERVGRTIVLGLPLGLGKANHFANALFERAVADNSINLTIFTALTLERPRPKSELERRFMEPLSERLFGDYPDLAYAAAQRSDSLPLNIRVHEFFLNPGAWIGADRAQQDYISLNYTHGARTLVELGVNVIGQLVAKRGRGQAATYSLSCNTDVTLDVVKLLRSAPDRPFALVGQVNSNLPFMPNDAEVAADYFDFLLDHPALDFTLFSAPKTPVSTADYAAGFHAASLVKDGGTLQIGIGSLSDAITYALTLRQSENATYRDLLQAFEIDTGDLATDIQARETGPFTTGIYGTSEMVVDGFVELIDAGILTRKVYPDARLQALVNKTAFSPVLNEASLKSLLDHGLISDPLKPGDVKWLVACGIFKQGTRHIGGKIKSPKGGRFAPALSPAVNRRKIAAACLENEISGGTILHGGFFLGSADFYRRLDALPENILNAINMTAISYINELYGDEPLKAAQRHSARFINTAMMVTATGAVISDGLENGTVISGVGGQYNFVSQAHALSGARSIIAVRATRTKKGKTRSNIVWNYGHTTIPRHMRDIVVTEYGIADLRGRSDSDVIAAMLKITDSRFQPGLLEQARTAGKIDPGYRIPERYRDNTPRRLKKIFEPHRQAGRFSAFPFGTDLTDDEIRLGRALRWLETKTTSLPALFGLAALLLVRGKSDPAMTGLLNRLALDRPDNLKEKIYARLVNTALRQSGRR